MNRCASDRTAAQARPDTVRRGQDLRTDRDVLGRTALSYCQNGSIGFQGSLYLLIERANTLSLHQCRAIRSASRIILLIVILLSFRLAHAAPAHATSGSHYYVDSLSGDDSNPGTSPDRHGAAWPRCTHDSLCPVTSSISAVDRAGMVA